MIRNIFIPESIGTYYIFPKRIVGFDIGRTHLYATIITAHGHMRTIEKCIEERIENDSNASHEERVTKALISILPKLGKYDAIYSALSSSLVIFKELSLPFIGLKKIKMVAPFEVEALLPFTLDSAVIDVIITKEYTQEQRSDVMVAAVKKEYIDEHTALFSAAGIEVNKITVDMFELYGMYKSIPGYADNTDTVCLVDLALYTTRIAILIEGQLKYIRVIPKGLIQVAKKMQSTIKKEIAEIITQLLRVGLDETDNAEYSTIAKQAMGELVHDLQFTIVSYTSKSQEQLKRIIITGTGSEVPGIAEFISLQLNVTTEILLAKKIIHNGLIQSKVTALPNSFLVSLATALSSPITKDFNLQQILANEEQERTLNKQLITIATLILATLIAFTTFSLIRVRGLRKAYAVSQSEALAKLKTTFALSGKAKTLKTANQEAMESLRRAQDKWSPLSHKNRFSFLKYLYELSRHINRKDIDLDLNSLTMDQNEIILTGKVKDLNAVRKFEEQLTSELFSLEDPLQVPEFKSRPIRLRINKP